MTYQTEFPTYPVADMPTIPQGFADESWRNDICPSFYSAALGLVLWTDFKDPSLREFPESVRFSVQPVDSDRALIGEPFDSDEWDSVLAFLIGEAFAANLRLELTESQWAEMREDNATPEYESGVCASHNHCDANMPMSDAFESIMGREIIPDEGEPTESDCALWGAAWDSAKARHLTAKEAGQ